MRKSVLFLFIVMLTAILNGCLLSKSPNTNDVTMTLSEQKTFSVNIFPSNATYAWTLDGSPLSNTEKSYNYTAEAGEHFLTVKAKHIFGTDTQTWNITCKSILSGTVTICGGGPLFGVTMTLSGAGSGTAATDTSGNYTFSGLANGSYTITPSLPGWTFDPVSSSKTVNGANVTGVNFTASVNSTMLWPLHLGDHFVYQYSDYTGAKELNDYIITGTTVIESRNFFTTNNSSIFLGSTENSVYLLDEGELKEYAVTSDIPIVSVTVPYGTFDAYRFTTYFTYPYSYQYDYIVQGHGIVKSSEHNDNTNRWWEWGDFKDFTPGPDCP